MDGIGSLEPLIIKKIKALSDVDGPVSINATLTNVFVTGFKDVKIVESR